MTEPFRWKNCFADVLSARYASMAQAFLREVVEPALSALDRQITAWETSNEPGAPFIHADTQELLRTTTMAFCLSVQSLWELQIRTYLQGCAKELRSDNRLVMKAMTGRWEELDSLFRDLRGISLADFEEYPDLDFLHLLGNACRHGDGPSMRVLWNRHPELWPNRLVSSVQPFSDDVPLAEPSPTFATMMIPRELLRRFTAAIASFWDETEYIYKESIERKHASLEATLVEMRRVRACRGKR
jgi:hypothetical protein